MTTPPPFKAAILMNAVPAESTPLLDDAFKTTFATCITQASPDAQVDSFDPIEAQVYPEAGEYDLIVLSGGTADAMAKDITWILKLQDFLRTTVERCPSQKIVGICWGHQTINIAFGGTVGDSDHAEIGVYPVTLTPNGQTFFTTSLPSETHYNIHQFHEREVKTRGKGFIALAENNQCFVNAANTILTLQGHPEMSVELSKMLLEDVPKYLDVEEVERKALEDRVEREHDGMAIWKRIVRWTGEV
ncbi:Class I glutamine amidotransferase-like protein [Glarea lozoyensis ATCC 20868]|uniref:Class I glutamine amidotransferase-like protein n=1 Tax=Glarea lozoyensis (strain ATCC 20868 / MF5171) TaxID=1116229 RepID=S3DRM6_GLAL2|nr:Class I glutamine amidotransferase-like protein [Glarea lozoyensis ATCC 20868]EPE29118.1 Class I glutamine amidotransferase-like protein [Glarea lozoyensis ATCC 20868]